jgi:hypothetical protein
MFNNYRIPGMKSLYSKLFPFAVIIIALSAWPLQAQQKTFNYSFKLQGTASTGDYLPFWLYSNKHGIVDINAPGGQAIFNLQKNLMNHHSGFDYGFGATVVGRYSEHPTAFFNQLYGVISYGPFQFKGGRFYEQLGNVDPSLSMGSLVISQNAAPMPKIKLGIPDYTAIPFTHGYMEIKGEIAHGWFGGGRFIKDPWLHQKSAYVRFGRNIPVRPYMGFVDDATWAGSFKTEGKYSSSFSDYLRLFFGQSGMGHVNRGDRVYKLGDHRGIWDFGLYIQIGHFNMNLYRQQIWEDTDGIAFRTPDGMSGLRIAMPKKGQQFVQKVVLEYLYTKNQSGPGIPGPTHGRDDYYNNYLYRTGWTYKGQTIGNPLFVNAYNPRLGTVVTANQYLNYKDPKGVPNNRIVAQHIGIKGQLSKAFGYKLLVTHSANYGNYWTDDLYNEKGIKTDFYANRNSGLFWQNSVIIQPSIPITHSGLRFHWLMIRGSFMIMSSGLCLALSCWALHPFRRRSSK